MNEHEIRAFVERLRDAGVSLQADGEQLRLRADKGVLTESLRRSIAQRKPEIVAYLGRAAQHERLQPFVRPERIPLSFAEQRLWFIDQLVGPSPTYNISSAMRIEGPLDAAALEAALNEIVARHEVLRTTFHSDNGEPYQRIADSVRIEIARIDVSGVPESERGAACDRAVQSVLGQSFDLRHDPMLRATLIRRAAEDSVLVLLVHHIVADGWSIGVLVDELTALYDAFSRGVPSALPQLPIQYADFSLWQRQWLSGDVLERQLAFWRNRLADAPPLLPLPTDRPRPAQQSFDGGHIRFRLPASQAEALHSLARRLKTTLYTVLLSAFAAMLHRHSGQDDIVVGTAIANRNRRELEPLVGFFVNTLALRAEVTSGLAFEELVRRFDAIAREAHDHQELPFERLVEDLHPERSMSHAPIAQVAFALQNAPRPPLRLGDLTLTPIAVDNGTAKFDLFLSMHEEDGELIGVWEYARDLFEPATVERFTRHFRTLLEGAASAPSTAIGRLPMLSEAERHTQLHVWNAPVAAPETVTLFLDRFRHWVACRPESPALARDGHAMSYAALDDASDRLAAVLAKAGVARGAIIGICLPRGFETWIALLAILKAGGAYLPLDPAYPAERLQFILRDSEAPLVVTDSASAARLSLPQTCRALRLDEPAEPSVAARAAPAVDLGPDDLAYVIYTSGSTGQPKGVQLTHLGLGNLAGSFARNFGVGPGEKVLQFASLSFDASTWEMAKALGSGACLQLLHQEQLVPDEDFVAWLARERVNLATLPPSFLAALPFAELPALRELIVAGEPIQHAVMARWAQGRRFTNAYGPTEATVCATAGACHATDAEITIGRPIQNATVYIVRDDLELLPAGAAGELLVGGLGVAKGYLGREELTASRFVPNPFGPGRLYRTGDLARYTPDGRIEFLGRIDHQAKLRGFRIEPGEIEAAIRRADWVEDALVALREDQPGEKRLVAYIQPRSARSSAEVARCEEWRELFQSIYAAPPDGDDPTFNIAGWNSSYDGTPLSADQMREWLDDTVARIAELHPSRVLEIGCGSGLVLSRVAAACAHYHGTDISKGAVEAIEALKARDPGLAHVTTSCRGADDFEGLVEGGYDLVILNSVVQYFPGIDYLRGVLAGAVRLLAPGGTIFLGDIRNYRLIEALQASVQFHRAPDDATRAALRERIRREIAAEEELYVDPAFFHALPAELPALRAVEIHLKRGSATNELNAFRYQVVLRTCAAEPAARPVALDWHRDGVTLAALAQTLSKSNVPVRVTRIPNRRLAAELDMLRWLREPDEATLGDWRARASLTAAVEPDALHRLATACGWRLRLTWSDDDAGAMDATFARQGEFAEDSVAGEPAGRLFANNPLLGKLSRALVPELRAQLQRSLPDYMIPAAFVLLERFPLTPNGKIDRAALPEPLGAHAAAAGQFAPPRNRSEEILVAIWQTLLRLERVGVHDNFFEIGGDSIISIQMISRAREAGLHLTPRQLFQHQTIAELARHAHEEQAVAAEQGPVVGPSALTPIQHWFFDTVTVDRHHFNQSLLVSFDAECDRARLLEILAVLVNHHDALRSRFHHAEGEWRQEFLSPVSAAALEPLLTWVDAGGEQPSESIADFQARCAALQADLDPVAGVLMRVAVRDPGAEHPKLLFWTVHHLAIDAVSWRILQEDFTTLFRRHREASPLRLPPKTTSFMAWSDALRRYAETAEGQAGHWRAVASVPVVPLPRKHSGGANTVASEARVVARLSRRHSGAFLQKAHAAYHTQANDLLLTALLMTFADWTGDTSLRLDLESHGRQGGPQDVDLSRTVGWFTALYPVCLSRDASETGALICSVKEQLRSIPDHGTGYGALRYLKRPAALQGADGAEVCFNYLGQFDSAPDDADALFTPVPDPDTGPIHGARQQRAYLLQINAVAIDGELAFRWHFSRGLHDESTVRGLAERFVAHLAALIDHCLAVAAPVFTPSDFPAATLTEAELRRLPLGPDAVDVCDASPLQEGMLFECQNAPHAGLYVEQIGLELTGALAPEALRRAWQDIVDRHAILRTRFHWERRCYQIVQKHAELPFVVEDWRGLDGAQQTTRYARWLEADKRAGFDPVRAPLMRVALLRLDDARWRLVWTSHHALMDGWCIPILFAELRTLYAAALNGAAPALAPPAPYRDFILWRRRQDFAQAEAYWRADLEGLESPTRLSTEPSSDKDDRRCGERRFHLSQSATAALEANARTHRLTLNTFIQAAWSLLLAHETGTTDVVHGTTLSGRPPGLAGVETMVGLFINTVPVRGHIDWNLPLRSWLVARQAQQAAREEQAFVPLRDIQAWSDAARGTPLFDTLLVFENYPFDETLRQSALAEDVAITGFESFGETSFPLTVVTSLPADRLGVRFTYDCGQFDAQRIALLAHRFEILLNGLGADLERPVSALTPFDAAERERLLNEGNPPAVAWPGEATVQAMFERHAARAPHALALVGADEARSYGEAARAAGALAQRLAELGCRPGAPIGLLLDASPAFVIGLLAAWRLRAPFVPLDPRWPAARHAEIVADAGITHLVVDEASPPSPAGIVRVRFDDTSGGDAPSRPALPEDLAYIVFTSGSTGRAKGVCVEHRQLHNYVRAIVDRFDLPANASTGEQSSFATTSGFSADLGYTMLFGALATGGRLHLAVQALARDPDDLARSLRARPVDYLKTVPSHFEALLGAADAAALVPGKALIFGGEALPQAQVARVQAISPATKIFNHYGPTETTIGVAAGRVDDRQAHPSEGALAAIGLPLANAQIYLLNAALEPVPRGAPGELYIGGDNVARGYLNNAGAGAFIPNPFGAGRLYRTGDRARRLDDGRILFLGRSDRQLKIRGYRIEPDEIAAVLRRRSDIGECVVVGRKSAAGRMRLLAYVTGARKDAGWPEELRGWLQEHVPEHMVPAHVIVVPALARLANGKIDLRALPEPHAGPSSEAAEAQSEVGRRLCAIFADVLNVPGVAPHENFFDLGGDSIVSIQIVARARQQGLHLTTRQIFSHQTIAELETVVDLAPASVPEQGAVTGPAPLTPIQKRFFESRPRDPHHYNQAMIFETAAEADDIASAFTAVLRHHDCLRLRYSDTGPLPLQIFADADDASGEIPFAVVDLSHLPEAEQREAIESRTAALQAGLDLVRGPITRLTLFRRGAGQAPLLHWVIHHLGVDGVSWRILLEDLDTACRQLRRGEPVVLPAKTHSFKRWAESLAARAPRLAPELPFWIAHGGTGAALPLDSASDADPDDAGSTARVSVALDAEETRALLTDAHAAYRTQINDLLLAAVADALAEWTGVRRVRIDVEGHGRETPDDDLDISRTIGWFTSLYPLTLALPAADLDPGETIKAVKEQLRQVPQNGIGYGILRYLAGNAALASQPAAPVVFNYLGQFDTGARRDEALVQAESDIGAGPSRSPRQRRAHHLQINAMVMGGRLRVSVDYGRNRHRARTIERFAAGILERLRRIVTHCLSSATGAPTASDFEMSGAEFAKLSRLLDSGRAKP